MNFKIQSVQDKWIMKNVATIQERIYAYAKQTMV